MSTRTSICAIALGTALASLFGADARAETYRDESRHFSFDIPEGWVRMPADQIAMINQEISMRMPGANVRYAAGFQPRGQGLGSYPYVLLEVKSLNTSGASYEEIERGLAAAPGSAQKQVKGAFDDVMKDLNIGRPVLDRSRNRILTRTSSQVVGVGQVDGLSVGHIGASGVVSLHGYARAADFAKRLPTFNRMADSFRYDRGHGFAPAPAEEKSKDGR